MMKNSLLIFLLFVFASAYSQHQPEVVFKADSYQSGFNFSKKENRPLVIRFVNNSSFSRNVNRDFFRDRKVFEIFDTRFHTIEINADLEENASIVKRFGVYQFPAYVFVDPASGEMLYKLIGKFSYTRLLDACERALGENNYIRMKEQYKNEENHSPDFLFNYAREMYWAGEDYNDLANAYFKAIENDILKDPHGLEAVLLFVEDYTDFRFLVLLQSWNQINQEHYPGQFINNKINEIISLGLARAKMQDSTISLRDSLLNMAEDYPIENVEFIESMSLIKYYQFTGKTSKKYYEQLLNYISGFFFELPEESLYDNLKTLTEKCKDEEISRQAMGIIMELIANNNRIEYQELLVKLYCKIGDYDEALRAIDVIETAQIDENMRSKYDGKVKELREYINEHQRKNQDKKHR